MGFLRILDRTRNTRKGGLVKDNLNSIDRLCDGVVVIDVALDKIEITCNFLKVFTETRSEIVDDVYPGTLPDQFIGEVGADKSGATRDKDFGG